MNFSHLPNILTIFRIILVPFSLTHLLIGNHLLAFYLFIIAGLSDGVDGYLARRFNWSSYFGSFADPLADKLLLISAFIALAYIDKLPMWAMILVIVRDITIMSGAAAWYCLLGEIDFKPMLLSKCNTVLQVLLVFLLLFELAYNAIPEFLITIVLASVVFTTIVTFIGYVWVWGNKAYCTWKIQ